jgi:sialate O-acetylesterase
MTIAGRDGTWRQRLSPRPASSTPFTLAFESSAGETAALRDVLFGDVYICGGQSNMQFGMGAVADRAEEVAKADKYPLIRLFTVGQKTGQSRSPLEDLQTVEQPWSVANRTTIVGNGGFGYFSAVCWFFGRQIADANPGVPLGLISNNWGGTKVELWTTQAGFDECKVNASGNGGLYNAMVHPYTVGPMAVTGFTWYQGESNIGHPDAYACLFPAMIKQWRASFQHGPEDVPYFGFVQLSTWCSGAVGVAKIRDAQMAALALDKVGYATNADHGAGCYIHPPVKQFCGMRLGNSALALVYGKDIPWKSPTFASATRTASGVRVEFNDLVGNLELRYPANYVRGLDCFKGRAAAPGVCAWAGLRSADAWTNATVSVDGRTLILSSQDAPPGAAVDATQYGYGAIPMMSVYDASTGLPVLPWNRSLAGETVLVV